MADGRPGNSAPIDATDNWWGSESVGYVNGKIWDKLDNDSLIAVNFLPTKINNASLIDGKFLCSKNSTCYDNSECLSEHKNLLNYFAKSSQKVHSLNITEHMSVKWPQRCYILGQ